MATVHVFVGQCGNQLGSAFLDSLVDEARGCGDDDAFASQISTRHFRPSPPSFARGGRRAEITPELSPPMPRCVMIDMEPKVIEEILKRYGSENANAGAYAFRANQCITCDEGSANNWAFGYYSQGSSRKDDIVESLRRESESSGTIGSFHVVHSIAGGTGSGVGCLVADTVREEFPHALLLHTAVWPFSTGEVVTQWYNCVMAMSALRDTADAVFIAHNDEFGDVAGTAARVVSGGGGARSQSAKVSFETINAGISRLLVDLHLPQQIARAPAAPPPPKGSTGIGIGIGIGIGSRAGAFLPAARPMAAPLRFSGVADIVEAVALDPAAKFFSGTAAPAAGAAAAQVLSWKSVLRGAARVSAAQFPRGSQCLWSLRGPQVWGEGFAELQDALKERQMDAAAVHMHERGLRGHEAHAAVFGPALSIGVHLASALERAEQLLDVNAFTHHFSRYGVGVDDIQDAIIRMWDTAAVYT